VEWKVEELKFIVLDEMLQYAEELYADADERKAKRRMAKVVAPNPNSKRTLANDWQRDNNDKTRQTGEGDQA
jgi:hypothetical protein